MPITAKSQITARARTRAPVPVEIVTPASPPPTLATWAVDVAVVDASKMHARAVNVLLAANVSPADINTRLAHESGVIDVAECMKVLFDFTLRSIETVTGCDVYTPQLYLEPLPPVKV